MIATDLSSCWKDRLALVVEDEAGIAGVLDAYLRRDGLRVMLAADGELAWRLFRQHRPDLVLLDLNLPGLDGLTLLKEIRGEGQTPVIIVTAMASDVDKLLGLHLGADDYIVKPFNPAEVMARVRAVLRRSLSVPQHVPLRVGPFEIDTDAHVAHWRDEQGVAQRLPLTLTEFRLLACLAAQPRRVFTRAELIGQCLPESGALERVIDSHMSKLRRKLPPAGQAQWIEAVRGIGYRLWCVS